MMSTPQAFAAHASPLTVAAFSPTGDRLVTCDGTGVVLLWTNLAAPEPAAWAMPRAAAVAAAPAATGATGAEVDGGLLFGGDSGLGDLGSEAALVAAAAAVEVDAVGALPEGGDGGQRGVRTSVATNGNVPWYLDAGGGDDGDVVTKGAAAGAGVGGAGGLMSPGALVGKKDGRGGFAAMLDQTPPPTVSTGRGRFAGVGEVRSVGILGGRGGGLVAVCCCLLFAADDEQIFVKMRQGFPKRVLVLCSLFYGVPVRVGFLNYCRLFDRALETSGKDKDSGRLSNQVKTHATYDRTSADVSSVTPVVERRM